MSVENETLCKEWKLWKRNQKILCVPEKENVLVQMGLSIVKVKGILIDSKNGCKRKENSINRIWT